MGKPRASVFSQVLAEITKAGNQTWKTVRKKNTSFKYIGHIVSHKFHTLSNNIQKNFILGHLN
jgi:hypothetical protein